MQTRTVCSQSSRGAPIRPAKKAAAAPKATAPAPLPEPPLPGEPGFDDAEDIVDAEVVDDPAPMGDDILDLLRHAIEAVPRMTEARAVKRARDIAQGMGLQKLPTDFESLSRFPKVLEALAAELLEAAS